MRNGIGCSKLRKNVEVSNCNKARGLHEFMDSNCTVTVIMDVFSRFEILWTEMTHPHKFKDRVCTLLNFNCFNFYRIDTYMIDPITTFGPGAQ